MPFTCQRIAASLRDRRRRLVGGIALGILVVASGVAWDAGRAAPEQATKPPAFANPHGDIKVACEECHTAAGWTAMRKPVLFDHAKTGFPLDGKHRGAACKDCHASLVFSRVAVSCADCHRDVHESRNGLACQDCHTPERWVGRADALRQHATTGFPLRGIHALLECTRCHAAPGDASVAKLSNECASCHAEDYAATTSPNHAAAGFPTRCEECHDASRTMWAGTGFDHAVTGFALTGVHQTLQCSRCHFGGDFTGLTSACVDCHIGDYEATTNPNHVASGFPTTCNSCHNTNGWVPANFDHAATGFPLTGAHRRVDCASCHVGGVFAGTASDCYACHRGDYEATTNPNHAAANFGTGCASCHTTNAWQPATFDHDQQFFRIESGRHAGRWSSCADCHPNASNYGVFDCLQCHEHNKADMDAKHQERPGYVYESNACYTCHRGV